MTVSEWICYISRSLFSVDIPIQFMVSWNVGRITSGNFFVCPAYVLVVYVSNVSAVVFFLHSLIIFNLGIYHGLRQNDRKCYIFYLPKFIVILPIWLLAVVLATWEKCNELKDPTYSHFVDTENYNVCCFFVCVPIVVLKLNISFQSFKTFFYIAGAMYLLYLSLLILKAYSELRSMPYFGKTKLICSR